ncbi:MAG: hypothetical protein RL701_4290 [Pseudomonadota bacterium]
MPDDIIARTLHPHELESALAQELDFLAADCLAVMRAPELQTCELAVVLELSADVLSWADLTVLGELATETVLAHCGDVRVRVWLLEAGGMPRTSSLAIDRERCRQELQVGGSGWSWLAHFEAGVLTRRALATAVALPGDTARELAELAASLLGVAELALDEHLFARGADSIACVRLVARVRERWGVELETRVVFEAPRIRELAERIDDLIACGAQVSAIAPVERTRAWPLSAAQLRIWLVAQLAGAGPAQHVAGGLRLRGPLDRTALRTAATRLAERHEILRTSIAVESGLPVQRVRAELPLVILEQPAAVSGDGLPRRVRAAAEAAFDFVSGPLWRIELSVLGPDDHLLVLCMHHAISDGWSTELAARELLQLYAAEVQPERAPVLPALPLQFIDYAAWESGWLAAGRAQQQLEYWRNQLGHEHEPLELPRVRARQDRSALSGRAGRMVALQFAPELTASLRTLAAEQGSTLFVVLLAAFQLWLARMTGRDDVRVGVPVLGRHRVETEGLIGCFVNTLVLRTQLEHAHDARTLVRTVDATLRGALTHADVPFDALVKALAPERSADHNPLFQVTYNHLRVSQHTFDDAAQFTRLQVERVAREPFGSPFALSLETEEDDAGQLRAIFNYPVELFEFETVGEFAGLFEVLIRQLALDPARRLSELALVSPAALVHWSAPHQPPLTAAAYATVPALVLQHAQQRPHALALVGAGERWTFGQLEASSRALAARLRELGVGPEVRVGIFVPRGPRMIVAALAIWRAGGAYVPLDPSYPAARLAFIVRDSQLRLLVTADADGGGGWPDDVVCVPLMAAGEQPSEVAIDQTPHVAQLAYVIYTSGSTGQPKGVAVAHGSLAMHCHEIGALYELSERDCALHFASFSFDAAVEQWTTPLAHGARLVISDAEPWTGEQIYDVVQNEAVSVVYPPTSHLRLLAQHALTLPAAGEAVVRAVCVGGEAVSREDHALITRALRPERFINGYGPTECVVTPLLWRSFARETPASNYVPIGRAVGQRRVYLLDTQWLPVAAGVIGEVFIGGAGLSRGYQARPSLTAASFIPDPWSEEPGARLYRTGDLGRWLPTGDVEYVGRRDQQVKLRGYRIELGEIEWRLREHDAVSDAVVLLVTNAAGHKRLVGYVETPNPEALQLSAALQAHLAALLPEHMVPAQFVALQLLPKTPNGKVDRKALPHPELVQAQGANDAAEAATDLERLLAQIWCDVLGLSRVGLDDNFFELGGDSIIALQVVSRARAAGVRVAPKHLFVHQTVRSLAAVSGSDAPVASVVAAEPAFGLVPLTPIQRSFFAAHWPVPQHFNQSVVLVPRRPLRAELVARACELVAEHHDALRLRYTAHTFEQHYAGRAEWTLRVQSAPLTAAEFALAADQMQRSLDLTMGPLSAALLATLDDGSQRLLLVIHHVLVDAVSWRVLIEDLETVYAQLERAEAVRLPARTASFRAFSEWLVQRAESPDVARELEFWTAQLESEGSPDLPCDMPHASLRAGSSATVAVELSEEATEQLLRRVPEAYRTQVNDVLLTALARVLCRWAGRETVSVSLEGHGRASELDLSRTVGWFTSVYPLQLTAALGLDHASTATALKGVKEQLRALPNNGIGYGVLTQLAAAGLREPLAARRAPRVTFNYLGQFDQSFSAASLFKLEASGASQHEDNPLSSWLSFDGLISEGRLSLQIRYSSELYRRETLLELAAAYRSELEHLIAHCVSPAAGGVTPADFPLLAAKQAQLDALPIAARELVAAYPLSPLQQGMLFHSLYAGTQRADSVYVSQLKLDVAGLDPERFVRAWQGAVARHEILRTAFVELEPGAGFVQLVHRHAVLPVRIEEQLSALALAQVEREERSVTFELSRPPLLRLAVLRLSERSHRLLLTHHHVLLDGWSLARLLEEVLRSYAGEPVATRPGSYGRYIAWLATRDALADERFWRRHLAALSEPCLLVGALAQTVDVSASAEPIAVLSEWSVEQTAALQQLAKRERVTVNTLIQAAWAIVLQRYTQRDAVAFGVTVAGRPAELADAETAIGLFINTIPVVLEVSPELEVGAWLREVQSANVAVREHEHAALADIQRWAGAPGQALFDTLLVVENYPVDKALRERGGADLHFLAVASEDETHYALTLEVRLDAQLGLRWKSSRKHMHVAALQHVAAHFAHVLAEIVRAPEAVMGELSLADARALSELSAWNETAVALDDQRLVHELIEAHAAAQPWALAVSAGSEALTYAELNARANQLARYLRASGVGPDVLVGLCALRALDLVVGLLAILKAGGAYLPLDPSYPRERLRTMIEDSGARLVITQAELLEVLPLTAAARQWCIDRDWSDAAEQSPAALSNACHDQHLAYVIYTSGSTGKPKGVELTHWGFRNYVRWALEAYRCAELDVSALHSSIAFDLTVTSLWLPLCAGKRVALTREGDVLSGLLELVGELAASGAKALLKITPSHALALAQAQTQPLANVRAWIVGGEALSWECVAALQRVAPNSRVINEYGPTEAVVGCCIQDAVAADSGKYESSVPIGRPIANTQLYVLDACLEPVPPGVTGELYIGGGSLARSYRRRPDLTAERFVPNPRATTPGERLYRTGDLARYRADGVLEYLGRSDHQVKLRGYRIELGEIEAALRAQPGVEDAVVIARQDAGAARLVGYVAARVAVPIQPLLERLRERLPEYMVPAQLVVLPALPLNANGKIERRALPAPERTLHTRHAPETELEALLLEIWRTQLRAPDAGVEDDFFELGGDSLVCLQVSSRARQHGVEISAKQVFEARTVLKLAAAVGGEAAPALATIPRAARSEWLPLSYAQERLWFLAQLAPDSSAYNVSGALRLRGALDVERLRASFAELVSRHETLRTSFQEHGERGMQHVHAQTEVVLRTLAVRGPDAEQRAHAAFARETLTPFTLAEAPLLRLLLLELSAEDHVLVVTMHHLITDAATTTLLLDELAALYARVPLAAPPALQYADYASWQRSELGAAELTAQLSYWREQLGAEHPLLELPLDRPRPATQSARGGVVAFSLDAATIAGVRRVGLTHGASTFMVLLAAFESLLYRLTGQRDVRVGMPVSNRSRVELEAVAGLFVNTLVVRAQLDGAMTFAALLAQLRATALAAQAHKDLPFERLVEALSPERSLSHNPLFQVLFDHQRAPLASGYRMGELAVTQFESREHATQLDLALETTEADGAIHGRFTYATDLFERSSVEALCARFQALLRQVVQAPERTLADLELLTPREHAQLMAAAGSDSLAHAFATDEFVHHRIAAQARVQPEAPALLGETGAPWTYGQLERVSNQWAHRLRELGVGPETKVGLCVGRSPRMVVAALAILKAGGAYVPLDPTYPLERLRAVIEDAGVHWVLTESRQLRAADTCVYLDVDVEDVSALPVFAPSVDLHGENLAYVVYTSGSTGRPKGVGVSHAGLARHVQAIGLDYGMRADDCALHFASISFDAGVEQWVSPLVHGARLFVRGDELWSADRAVTVLREQGVTWFEMPPGYLREVAEAALARGETLQLRGCTAGGEAVSRESLGVMLRAVYPASVINGYGPTETVITPMTWHATDIAQCTTAYAPIGRVVGPRRSYVLDADLNLVPVGVTGELYLGGLGVARGYVGRPDLTAERFVPDPYALVLGQRMYRTGDLARARADGSVEYVGRADHQVKVRGFRIELGEIEAQLLLHAGVREAVVVAEGGALAARLIGYVAGAVDLEALRAQLRAALPEYMVPAHLLVLAELPRNSNGKIDRKQLPKPELTLLAYEPPATALETQLCGIWCEVLELPRVGRRDNFFELGGDSIRSLRVISRARKLGFELRPRDMFECRNLAELALTAARSEVESDSVLPELRALPRTSDVYALSYAQERLWFLAQLDPSSAAYNIAGAVQVSGVLDVAALAAAMVRLTARHEALRTTFEARAGQPWQRVHAAADSGVQLQVHDCRGAGEGAARALVEAQAHTPFDLARGPLVRVSALRVSDDSHVLCLVMHHIIADGWSLDNTIAELSLLYADAERELSPLRIQYSDYASWQRAWLTGAELERQVAFWKSELGTDHPVIALPNDHVRPQVPSQRGGVIDIHVDSALGQQLREFALAHDTTLFVVLLATWQTVLQRLSAQPEVRVGVPVTNRNRVETENVIGLFVNTLVVRSDYDPNCNFEQIVARTRERVLSGQAHQDVPFERLVELLQPARSQGHNPLFQVLYNHLRRSDHLFVNTPELQVSAFEWQSELTQFDLMLDTEEAANGVVSGRLTFARDLFEPATAQRWAEQFQRALAALVAQPTAAVGNVSWLAASERSALLTAGAQRATLPAHGLLHERISAQALRRPAAIACSYDGEQLSYGALELRANQWAQRLRKLGVGPDVLVGLCVERSLELVVGVLAILKAGGAYVPLDPAAPADRLTYMIEDSRLSLVLTQTALAERFTALPAPSVLCLDREDVRAEATSAPHTETGPDQLAYVIYTSGSTGKPKGALLTHHNVTRLFDATQRWFAFDEHDVWSLFHSYAFDFSVWELFGALLYGGSVVIVPYDVSRSSSDFYALLLREKVTVLNQTPAAFRPLAAVACAAPASDRLALRRVIFGGEALELEALRPWFERFGDDKPELINMYGITETTVHVTYRPLRHADLERAVCSPIGEPLADLALYVLDSALEPCSWGVTGELYVGGAGLARGYLGRAALSAERFIPNPFGAGRLYRSGDLALRRADGGLEYLGRSDQQVKIRGFRIELGEIAAQLQAHASVREAAVIARPGPSGQRLVGYVTLQVGSADEAAASDELKAHLRRALPEYMVPAAIIVLPELPLTVNGKLDRQRLPEQAQRTAAFVPPSSEIERQLAQIWCEVLGCALERIGDSADFFELGGHSLLITQVASRVQKQFGVVLPLRQLFEATTLQTLAARIAEASAAGGSEAKLDALAALLSDLENES